MSQAPGAIQELPRPAPAASLHRGALAAWVVGLVALTALPYVYLSARTAHYADAEAHFNWIIPPYPEDSYSYAAWVEQASSGAWLLQLKYTGIDHAAAVFHPLFLLVGWLSAATGLDASQSLFVARLLGVLLFSAALVSFLGRLPLDPRGRWIALWLVAFSSGAGMLAAQLGLRSADLWMPELSTLWSLTWNPVFTFALALMLWIAALVQRFDVERRDSALVWAGLATGLLAFMHPYDVPVLVIVTTLVIATGPVGMPRLRPLGLYLMTSAPAVLVQLAVVGLHPVLSAHSGALMSSPPPSSYLSGLGLPGLLFALGLLVLLREHRWRGLRLPLFWVGVSALLVYSPVWFQRHMALGLHLPVCIVAAVGLERIAGLASRGRPAVFAAVVALIVAVSGFTHFHNALMSERAVRREPSAYFLSGELAQALATLKARSDPADRVLAHPSIAVQIPGRTGNPVLVGHWAQSVDSQETQRWLGFLFSQAPEVRDAERRAALHERRVRYVLVEPKMRRDWFRGATPEWLEGDFEVVFQGDRVALLEARR